MTHVPEIRPTRTTSPSALAWQIPGSRSARADPSGDALVCRTMIATATALGLTGTEQSLLPGLGTGQGLWRIKDRSFVVQHQLHPAELAAFDTTSRMTEGVT